METSAFGHLSLWQYGLAMRHTRRSHVFRCQHHPRAPVCHKGCASVNQASTMVRARERRPDQGGSVTAHIYRHSKVWPRFPTRRPIIPARAILRRSRAMGRRLRRAVLCCDAGVCSLAQYSNERQLRAPGTRATMARRWPVGAPAAGTLSAFGALRKIAQAETPPRSAPHRVSAASRPVSSRRSPSLLGLPKDLRQCVLHE